jgi:hypothetical protein
MEGPRADSEEKQEPASDFDTALEDRLKALDPERPIREADIGDGGCDVGFGPIPDVAAPVIRPAIKRPKAQGRMSRKFGIAIQSMMPLGDCNKAAILRSSSVSIPTPSCIPSFRLCETMRWLSD